MAAESLTRRTARAAQWRLASSIVGAVLQLGVGVLLARLLTPADFGVAALAYVVLGFAQPLGDLGLGSAVVRHVDLTERHIRTAFTTSLVLGIAIAATMMAAAPLGAAVMHDLRVVPILRWLSVGVALRGTGVVAEALLRRQLDFRRQFLIETASYFVGFGGVAVTLALLGYGVWSLVWGGLVQTAIAAIAELTIVRHSIRPLLARRELQELLGFGLGAAASACVNYVALNGDYFVIGRLMGAFNLGLYTRAYGLMNVPHTYAAGVMSGVMFPAFAQVQQEPARVRTGYLVVTRLTAMIAAPAMATMVIVAPHFVRGLYGPLWSGAVVPLQILSIAGYFRALYHLGGIVAQSVGRVYGELWRQVGYAAFVIAGSLLGSRFGLPGVAVGVSVAILFMFAATGHLALRATETSWREYFRVQAGAIVVAGFTAAIAVVVRLLLEASQTSAVIAVAVLAAAAVPWSVGMLWMLGEPDLEPLRTALPRPAQRAIEAVRRPTSRSHESILDRPHESNRCHVLVERVNTLPAPGRIYAFSKCRNERLRLPAFLDHYRRLGVDRFFIVDNDSTDGSDNYLSSQADVHLFRAAGRFSEARGGTDWLNALLSEYGVGSWCVTVDIDELLVYPASESTSLRVLTTYLDRSGHEALSCLLLDLYPVGPLDQCSYQPGGDLVVAAPCFDAGGYERSQADLCPGVLMRGGMRQRVFYPEFNARGLAASVYDDVFNRATALLRRSTGLEIPPRPSPPCLTKVPLVRWDQNSEYLDCNHWVSSKRVAPDTGALLHFKFLHDFHVRAVEEAARGEYYNGASEYRRYAQKLAEEPALTLATDASTRFEGSSQLVRLGLMRETDAWANARSMGTRTDRQVSE